MDGTVRTVTHLIETLEAEGVTYRLYSAFQPDDTIRWSDRVKKVVSVPFLLYPTYRVALPQISRIGRDLDAFQPDLVHVTSPALHGLYGLKYARKRNRPVVASYHTHFIHYFPYYGLARFEGWGWAYLRWFYNQFDRIYAPSNQVITELKNHRIERCELWQRGIELDRFSPSYRDDNLRRSVGSTDDPILLFVSRLVKEKDLDDLVKAVDLLNTRSYAFRLVLVGDGPLREALEDQLPEARFTGHLEDHQLSEWFASADIFVFPSTTETFGNVILEAMASGLPVVGVRAGGVVDLISEGSDGLLAEPKDPSGFAEKIAFLLDHPEKRSGMAQNALVKAHQYSWESINKGLLKSYRTLIDSSP
jgi:glycosyltransferase involved in cell wall biosynthesis